MTTLQFLQSIQKQLAPAAGEFALPEAERILEFLLNCSRSELYLSAGKELPPETFIKTEKIIERRVRDEPLAYILGSAYFYNREFAVMPDVLIPRPDTEVLVEQVLANELPEKRRFLDMGTGSGSIAAVLIGRNPSWKAIGTDLSFASLRIARKNCQKEPALLCCDRLSALNLKPAFDFIVSNPPYIPSLAIATLPESVRNYEPISALDGGTDGLDFYRYLADVAPRLLKAGGRIYCEIGCDQGDDVPEIFSSYGWNTISITKDLGKRPRVLRALK
jgi:release factor glutamine methyltransferase